jgi:hypothetical protein
LAQRVVEALDGAGLTTVFANRNVLAYRDDREVVLEEIAVAAPDTRDYMRNGSNISGVFRFPSGKRQK